MSKPSKTIFTISPGIAKVLDAHDSGTLDLLVPEMGERAVAIRKKWWHGGKLTAVRFTGDIWSPCDEESIITQASKADFTSDKKILDIACGIGGPARILAKRYRCHVTGLDIDDNAIEMARALTCLEDLSDLVTFEVSDRSHLPYEQDSFDIVWGHGGWGGSDDPWREAARVLKAGGQIIATEGVSRIQLLVELGFAEIRFYTYYRQERLRNVQKFLKAMEEHREEIVARAGEENYRDWHVPKERELEELASSKYPYGVVLGIKQ